MSFKKNLEKLLSEPTEIKLEEVTNILNNWGYRLDRIRGSHHIFSKPGYDTITVPVHNRKITKRYLKMIKEKINIFKI